MQAARGDLARGVEARHARAAVDVDANAADDVVRGGRDREQVARQVVAGLGARLPDRREPRAQVLLAEVARVEPDVVAAAALHDVLDLAAHDVARRELGKRVHAEHEALFVAVEQVGALASQRLGDEEARRRLVVERGGVELHELEVGDLGARAPGRGQAVAGRDERVGGDAEDLAGAAGREHDRVGPEHLELARLGVEHERADAAFAGGEQVDEEALLEHADALRCAQRLRRARPALRRRSRRPSAARAAASGRLRARVRPRRPRRDRSACRRPGGRRARQAPRPRRRARPPRRTAPGRRRACRRGAARRCRPRPPRRRCRPARTRCWSRRGGTW